MIEDLEERTVVVYDGDCAFCRRSIAAIQSRDRHNQFAYLPRKTPGLEERYPQLALEDFDSGIRVVGQDGTVHVGADGIHQIASGLPYFRRWAWLYHAPGVHGVTRRMYAWVAANRMKLSRSCEGDCEVDPALDHSAASGTE